MTINHLFVYGTLMSCFNNSVAVYLKRYGTKVGNGSIKGELRAVYYDFWYPVAILSSESKARIKGEIIEIVPDCLEEVLKVLDEYEGVTLEKERSMYERKTVRILMETGEIMNCFMYVALRKNGLERFSKIPCGDFYTFFQKQTD